MFCRLARLAVLAKLAPTLLFLALAACAPSPTNDTGDDTGGDVDAGPISDDDPAKTTDTDGDTISDADEGVASDVDTDNDGTPDFRDTDSDDDGISDAVEAGDDRLDTSPIDSDLDATPDYRDRDSDGNGLDDADDGIEDLDGDGIADYADLDDDGDSLSDVLEIGGDPNSIVDTDRDGTFDYRDIDSDADTILDKEERATDPDGDLLPSYVDADADGDCVLDASEAGDSDLDSPPVDTDGDARPNYLDLDSDNDGLSDGHEDRNCNGVVDSGETSPIDEDSDDDGVIDVVEETAGTDPTDPNDNPAARGDFFFVVPFQQPTSPLRDTLEFRTSVQFADIYFSFDTTASMEDELTAMRQSVPSIVDQLRCQSTGGTCTEDADCATGVCFGGQCIEDPTPDPGCIPDMHTGVGTFSELDTFVNRLSLQADPARTASAIPGTSQGGSEAPIQAPACVADASNCRNFNRGCTNSGVGCVGFRAQAIRLLIQITDADQQCFGFRCGQFTAATTGRALLDKGIKFLSLVGTDDDDGTGTPRSVAESIGVAAGTVDAQNNPFVFDAEDSGVVPQTVAAVLEVVRGVALNVTIGQEDAPNDSGDALQFIDHVEVNVSGNGNCTAVRETADTDGDTRPDSFPSLRPGTPICWDVVPIASNGSVPATSEPQIFRATLTVRGDGSPLDSRDVFFLIPPLIEEPPIE